MFLDANGFPVSLPEGIRCGNHSERTYHADVDTIRECYRLWAELEAQSVADYEAESRLERWYEERGAQYMVGHEPHDW